MSYGVNGWWKSCGATVVVFVLVAMMAGHRYTAHGLSQTDTTKVHRPTQKDQHRWVGFFWKAAADKNNSQASRRSLGRIQERHAPVVFRVTAIFQGGRKSCAGLFVRTGWYVFDSAINGANTVSVRSRQPCDYLQDVIELFE